MEAGSLNKVVENNEELIEFIDNNDFEESLKGLLVSLKNVFNLINFAEYKVYIENLFYEVEMVFIELRTSEVPFSLTLRENNSKIYLEEFKLLYLDILKYKGITLKEVISSVLNEEYTIEENNIEKDKVKKTLTFLGLKRERINSLR